MQFLIEWGKISFKKKLWFDLTSYIKRRMKATLNSMLVNNQNLINR